MPNRVGQQFGNYRLVRLLGQGGFAEVYLGEHIYLDTLAAIKVLRAELASDEEERFRSEARTIARLVHPHIVRVLDFGVHESTPFLVMDYAPDGTLRKHHPRGTQVPLSTIVRYVTQLAGALQYAHDQKVIHRDIKPENMLLDRRNEVLLSDFGIALVTSSRYHSTQGVQDLVGTVAYMAPEQIQAHAVPASDQYALGIVVYEWLSGTRPFEGSFTEVAVKQVLAVPPSLREKLPTLSVTVEQVVMKALAKDPLQRFASIEDFAAALEQAYRNEPVSSIIPSSTPASHELSVPGDTVPFSPELASLQALLATPVLSSPQSSPLPAPAASQSSETPLPPVETTALGEPQAAPASPRAPRRRVSRRTVLVGLAAIAAAGALGGGVAGLEYLQGRRRAETPHSSPTTGGTALYTYRGHSALVWSVAWAPDGKRIASASSDKTVQVWNAADGGDVYTYTGHADSVYAVAWSPDGRRIASASYDTTVQVWDATGGHPFTYSGHSTWVWSVAWAPDSRRIASAGGDKTVQVWDAIDGRQLYTYVGHIAPVYAVAWSPEGQRIASAGVDGTVQVWDAATGSRLYTYQPYSSSLFWSLAWSPDGRRIAVASSDKTVQVWDAASGDHLYVYYGHTDSVYTVSWSLDGRRIASGGDDMTVQVWNAADGGNVYTYAGHSNSVRAVAWVPGSRRIASGSWDKTVQVWQAR